MSVKETTIEIRLNNLAHNISELKSFLQPHTLFMAVVKAFSYGNNSNEIARYLQKNNLVDYFTVAYVNEGVELRESGIKLPIMILHPQESHFQKIIDYHLEPTLYSQRICYNFIDFAKTQNLHHYPVHLKFNSGMNRLGFSLEQTHKIIPDINQENCIKIISAYSHLMASEDKKARPFIENQIQQFIEFQNIIKSSFTHKILFHICNTSGILNYPEAHFDMVRSGIGMYGFANDAQLQKRFRPIASLKTIISQIHTVKPLQFVGYNFGFQAKKITRTATISVGHADGLNRIYGKGIGFVFINEKKAPIIGNVCMDMLMVDISDIDCKEGDEVIIFNQTHTAEILAEEAKTISYELITSLSRRINRIYIE